MKNKRKITTFVILLAVFIVTIAGYMVYKNSDAVRVREQLDLGEKHLADQDYEQAIIAYETVIEIEPMNVEAYLGLADAYVGKGDYETAKSVLQKGYDLTEDEAIKNKMNEVNAEIEKIEKQEELRILAEEKKQVEQVNELQLNIDLEEIEWTYKWLQIYNPIYYHLTDEQTREMFWPFIQQIELYLMEDNNCAVACETLAELYYRINELDKCLYYRKLAYDLTGNELDNPKETTIDKTTYNEYGKTIKYVDDDGGVRMYTYKENKYLKEEYFSAGEELPLTSDYFYLDDGRIDYCTVLYPNANNSFREEYNYEGNNVQIDLVTEDGTRPYFQHKFDELDRFIEFVRYGENGRGGIEIESHGKWEYNDVKHEIVVITE